MGAGAAFAAMAGVQIMSSIGQGQQAKSAAKFQSRQYQLQAQQLEQEKKILTEQYQTKRHLLVGELTNKAAKSGVKLSGSVADSLSQSLTELGLEESRQKYNISMNQVNAKYASKVAKVQGRLAQINSWMGAGTTALSSYMTYNQYWGSGDKGGNGNTTGK
jgi:DNA anti-recombination protein RmuC